MKEPFFCDPFKDKALPVIELDKSSLDETLELSKDYFYLLDDTIYEFVGTVTNDSDLPNGCIGKSGNKYYIEEHTAYTKPAYNIQYVIEKELYESRITEAGLEDAVAKYVHNAHTNNNILKAGNIRIVPSGNVYIPELNPTDDPLERIVKLMLRHIKVVLNDHRGIFNKKHQIDNIKSALDGATKNMSITKFLSWCENFNWQWEFTFDNINPRVENPMSGPIVLSSAYPLPWEQVPPETKECFTVPLVDGEDPLKRGIKLVLWDKKIDIKKYKHRSPTPHLINNMKSALKSKQKMTLLYAMSWCEIIDVEYQFKITNKEDGVWYKIIGYTVTTNGEEE